LLLINVFSPARVTRLLSKPRTTLSKKRDLGSALPGLGAQTCLTGMAEIILYDGFTLVDACTYGRVEVVEILIERGADIEGKDDYGDTPLIEASASGRVEVVEILVERGADIEAKDYYGNTPLLIASMDEHVEVVKFLIESGADIEAKNDSGHDFTRYLRRDEVNKFMEGLSFSVKPAKTQRR